MNSKKIPWFYPQFGEDEKQEVLKVLESGYINDGDVTRAFEKKMASFLGVKHCVAVTSGTAAIALSLMGFGIGPGDEVIVPDFTFIATANAVRLSGAEVKLVDIEPSRFSIDVTKAKLAIGPKTKAIIAVDVNGRGADYANLESICKENNLILICDSAEALGSKYQGRYLGTYGDAGCFSFSANKTVSSGQGGMIATDNSNLYDRLRELKDQGRRHGGTGGDDLHPVLGFNFKYTNLQAAVALKQFDRLPSRLKHFNERDKGYRNLLSNCSIITLPPMDDEDLEICQWTDILCQDRVELESLFNAHNVGFRPFWFPLHRQKPYEQSDENFPNAIRISGEGLWLPSSFEITQDEITQVSKLIKQHEEMHGKIQV
jgi:perosamine synthetase